MDSALCVRLSGFCGLLVLDDYWSRLARTHLVRNLRLYRSPHHTQGEAVMKQAIKEWFKRVLVLWGFGPEKKGDDYWEYKS